MITHVKRNLSKTSTEPGAARCIVIAIGSRKGARVRRYRRDLRLRGSLSPAIEDANDVGFGRRRGFEEPGSPRGTPEAPIGNASLTSRGTIRDGGVRVVPCDRSIGTPVSVTNAISESTEDLARSRTEREVNIAKTTYQEEVLNATGSGSDGGNRNGAWKRGEESNADGGGGEIRRTNVESAGKASPTRTKHTTKLTRTRLRERQGGWLANGEGVTPCEGGEAAGRRLTERLVFTVCLMCAGGEARERFGGVTADEGGEAKARRLSKCQVFRRGTVKRDNNLPQIT